MKYAIVQIKGSQYKIEEGKNIKVNRISDPKWVELDKILAYSEDTDLIVDQDELKNVKIKLEKVADVLGKKVVIRKFKRRKRYHKTQGHRQKQSLVLIKEINKEKK